MGAIDRSTRIVLGIALIAFGLTQVLNGGPLIATYCGGGIALLTGVVRYCPEWTLFGINTCPLKTGQSR